MKRTKTLISQTLANLCSNIERTGDPLGFKNIYWTDWTKKLNLPQKGDTILFTSRMYQMLPYVIQATELTEKYKSMISRKGFGKILSVGNRLAGEKMIRMKAKNSDALKLQASNILEGIVSALQMVGENPAYLHEDDLYIGTLLYDLGLEKEITLHVQKVYKILKSRGVKRIITVDPHTTHMLKDIYPQYIEDYDLAVKHYLEVLAENIDKLPKNGSNETQAYVLHDSCVMTRNLGIIDQSRIVLNQLGIKISEPENAKLDTACCGGPIEYAFGDLSSKISSSRIEELKKVNHNIIVTCPICLINLAKYENENNVEIHDIGELLHNIKGETK